MPRPPVCRTLESLSRGPPLASTSKGPTRSTHGPQPLPPPARPLSTSPPTRSIMTRLGRYEYQHVPGYFHFDVAAPLITPEDSLTKGCFGLLDTASGCWERLKIELDELNESGRALGESYKLLYLARHQQGHHNVAEAKYTAEGTWLTKWAHESTDGTIVWGPDASLTEHGIASTAPLRAAWLKAAREGVIPLPTRWLVSPLQRTCQTCILTWCDVWSEHLGKGKDGSGVGVEVLENLRERAWFHECDHRRPKSVTQAQFPGLVFPDDMPEEDTLWRADQHESKESCERRVQDVLDEVWLKDDTYVSLTGHADIMRACFKVIGHPICPIAPGQLIPLIVRRVRKKKV